MKVLATSLAFLTTVTSFSVVQHHHQSRSSTTRSTSLEAAPSSRREAMAVVASSGLALLAPLVARADIDYSKVQDLLGTPDSSASTQSYGGGEKRPAFLTEPTQEFKDNEAKAAIFKRAQLEAKKKFLTVLEKLETDPNDASKLADDLDQMRRLVRQEGGLPLGITKEELIKRVRRRKAKRFWPTDVEIAYQDLISEIQYQQSPNTDKDSENPL